MDGRSGCRLLIAATMEVGVEATRRMVKFISVERGWYCRVISHAVRILASGRRMQAVLGVEELLLLLNLLLCNVVVVHAGPLGRNELTSLLHLLWVVDHRGSTNVELLPLGKPLLHLLDHALEALKGLI